MYRPEASLPLDVEGEARSRTGRNTGQFVSARESDPGRPGSQWSRPVTYLNPRADVLHLAGSGARDKQATLASS
jgi:hypothetical protein